MCKMRLDASPLSPTKAQTCSTTDYNIHAVNTKHHIPRRIRCDRSVIDSTATKCYDKTRINDANKGAINNRKVGHQITVGPALTGKSTPVAAARFMSTTVVIVFVTSSLSPSVSRKNADEPNALTSL